MDSTPESQGGVPDWRGDQAPCVYCGQVISRTEERCPHCRTSMSVAVRRASREIIGPWYYLDPRNLSGRGVTFEALIKMIEKGRIRHDSIVRGPTTHQDWMYAAEAPRLAKYLGVCPHCFAEARPEDTYCTRCQLNMNSRPAEPRPGIPGDLVKPPQHKAAYDIECELAGITQTSDEMLEGEALDVPASPPPAPAPVLPAPVPVAARAEPTPWPAARAEPTPPSRPAARVESAATLAAAAQLASGGGHAGGSHESPVAALSAITSERPMSVSTPRRRKPKLWIVLGLTWATLGAVVLVLILFGSRSIPDKILEKGGVNPSPQPTAPATPPNANEAWLADRIKEVDKAVAVRDYTKAIEVSEAIRSKTGDAAWDARIEDLKRLQADDRRGRSSRLKDRLESAEKLATGRRYDDAIAILRSIPKEDRVFLAELGVGVDLMERQYREDQIKWDARQQREGQLKVAVDRAKQLQGAKRIEEALAALKDIKRAYGDAPELIQKLTPTLDADIQALEAQVAAAKPVKIDPPPKVEVTPEQAAVMVADLMKQAADQEKAEKLKEALATLQEIKRFDKKYWPDNLDERMRQVNAKIQALIFFGLGGDTPPKKEKGKGP